MLESKVLYLVFYLFDYCITSIESIGFSPTGRRGVLSGKFNSVLHNSLHFHLVCPFLGSERVRTLFHLKVKSITGGMWYY